MGACHGIHCPGCGSGGNSGSSGGGGRGAGLALAVLVIAALASAEHRAIGHAIGELVTIVAWTVGTLAGLAVAAGLAWAGLRLRRSPLHARARVRRAERAALSGPQRAGRVIPGRVIRGELPRPQRAAQPRGQERVTRPRSRVR